MAKMVYKATVLRRDLSAQFQRGGQGWNWMDRVRLKMHTGVEKYIATHSESRHSPGGGAVRSGALLRGIRSYQRGVNQYRCDFEIVSTAPHSEWVHQGVEGTIHPGDGFFYLPAGAGFKRKRLKTEIGVRGQKANPFLDNPCTRIAISEGAVPYG